MKVIYWALTLALGMSSAAYAANRKPASVPNKVMEVVSKIRKNDVRVVVTRVEATEGETDGCSDPELHYDVNVRIRKEVMGDPSKPAKYVWETVRTLSVTPDGGVMEICKE